ncbi:MAG: DUF218 domain-containing protein [Dactylosporangium sp.]|nr:YdcF family protein [Dactylosporangium sp.]NNJ60440.1 DUF218 domain-containing protein [Dactylosporangium sp.]
MLRSSARRWLRPRRLLSVGLALGLVFVLTVGCCVAWVRQASGNHRFTSVQDVPDTPVALVLGNRVYPGGGVSRILRGRLDTARRLYTAGKVRVILLSGDSVSPGYDEVGTMRQWLERHGVPAARIVEDPAGLDTYSSCVRAVKIFGVPRATVVTQAYHLPRAVTLCRKAGLDAVGIQADMPKLSAFTRHRRALRDNLACVKAVGEVIIKPDPQYLGEPETGVEEALADP